MDIRAADSPSSPDSTKPSVSIWKQVFGVKKSKVQVQNIATNQPPPVDVLTYAMDMLPDMICVIDKKCNLLYTNRAFKTLITEDIEEVRNVAEFLREDSVSALIAELTKIEDSASVSHFSLELTFSSVFHRLCQKHRGATMEWDINGSSSRDIVVIRVELSSAQGSAARLRQAKQDAVAKEMLIKYHAVQANLEAQRLYIRCVNHEIRTPLNVIMNGISILESLQETASSFTDEAVRDTVLELRLSCVAATDIMDDIRFYQEINRRHLELNKTSVSLSCLVHDCVDELADLARNQDVSLAVSAKDDSTVFVSVDVPVFSHALRNVLSNALRFTPAKGQVIAQVVVQSERLVRVEVSDTGPGIAIAKQATLFADILNFTPTVNNTEQGYGVGFYVAHGIVALHGGKVGVRSDGQGTGSTFYFEVAIDHSDGEASQADILETSSMVVIHQSSTAEPISPAKSKGTSFRSISIARIPVAPDFMSRPSMSDAPISPRRPRIARIGKTVCSLRFDGINCFVVAAVMEDRRKSVPTLLRILIVDDVQSAHCLCLSYSFLKHICMY